MKPDVWIITGSQRIGKTVLLLDLYQQVQEKKNIPMCGVISPGFYIQDEREKIIAQNVETGEKHDLANYLPGWDTTMPEKVWKMDKDGILWGNTQLKNCEPKGKVFLLDEIGIYELLEGEGWQAGLEILKRRQYCKAIVTVRKEVLGSLINICEEEHILYELFDLDDPTAEKQRFIEEILSTLPGEL
ncbi:MAG: hypothetical protein XD73_0462 [Anaerolinea thermophila]|uniref:NTPase n=1 Tax=Anaerolinea thermophila TaxID=167964 RepID=A0A101FYI2_9CHLR|nr:MAG: hypothetical protein XD73_0462 [Anaerolinea thermophila]